jgi:hypothetical protein
MRMRKPKPGTKGTEVSRSPGQQSTNTLSSVVDLLVEYRIKLDALEYVLKETNPPAYELYRGTIENLHAQKASVVNLIAFPDA